MKSDTIFTGLNSRQGCVPFWRLLRRMCFPAFSSCLRPPRSLTHGPFIHPQNQQWRAESSGLITLSLLPSSHVLWLLTLGLPFHFWESFWLCWAHLACIHARHVCLFATPWAVACEAPLSTGLSRREYWSELLFPPPGDLPDPEVEPVFPMGPHWQVHSLPLSHNLPISRSADWQF